MHSHSQSLSHTTREGILQGLYGQWIRMKQLYNLYIVQNHKRVTPKVNQWDAGQLLPPCTDSQCYLTETLQKVHNSPKDPYSITIQTIFKDLIGSGHWENEKKLKESHRPKSSSKTVNEDGRQVPPIFSCVLLLLLDFFQCIIILT